MATVSFTRYHDAAAVARTNTYIVDGHGSPSERTNRYITDGHGGTTLCKAHNCPSNVAAASVYMDALRSIYTHNNSHKAVVAGESKRRDITHVQFYVSWAENENVPEQEMLEMTRELIERTALKDYACLYASHTNTDNRHTHISLCPYSLDGTKKLGITDRLKHDIWREADHICVEHDYSIVNTPVLLADPAYRQWFDDVLREGKVTIWSSSRENRRKSESKHRYKAAKEADMKKQAAVLTAQKHERKYAAYGVKINAGNRPDFQCDIAAKMVWAIQASKHATDDALKSRLNKSAINAYNALQLMERLDIRTRTELEQHITDVGADIAILKKSIRDGNPRAPQWELLLEHRKEEYRDLQFARKIVMRSHKEYVEQMVRHSADQMIRYASADEVYSAIREMSGLLGIPFFQIAVIVNEAEQNQDETTIAYKAAMQQLMRLHEETRHFHIMGLLTFLLAVYVGYKEAILERQLMEIKEAARCIKIKIDLAEKETLSARRFLEDCLEDDDEGFKELAIQEFFARMDEVEKHYDAAFVAGVCAGIMPSFTRPSINQMIQDAREKAEKKKAHNDEREW